MKGNLKRLFLIWSLVMIVIIAFYAIFIPSPLREDLNEPSFSTSQSSLLYFKNMRAYFHEKETHEQSGFEIYRIKSRDENLPITLKIINNWRLSEAYIMYESSIDSVQLSQLALKYLDRNERDLLRGSDVISHYRFSASLYKALMEKQNISIIYQESEIILNEDQRKSMKQVLKDYFKLVGKIR